MPVNFQAFNDNAFSVTSLTAAINQIPEGQALPTLLDSLFEEEGITTTSVLIEREGNELALVPASERGTPRVVTHASKRDLVPFATLHLATIASIRADEFQNIRAFGSENTLQTLQSLVAKRLHKMRQPKF